MTRQRSERLLERGLHGALGGLLAAATMSMARMVAHRLGWIRKTVPQAVEEWISGPATSRQARRGGSRGDARQQLRAQALHLAYGAVSGGAYGLARRSGGGWLFGLGHWALNFLVLMPALGITRPAWRSHLKENLVNLGAHVLYGAGTALAMEQLQRQPGPHLGGGTRLAGTVA